MVRGTYGMTIGEVASKYDLSLRSLRLYEEMGILAPLRTGSGRYYMPKYIIRLEVVLKGKKLGLSLKEVVEIIDAAPKGDQIAKSVVANLPADQIAEKLHQLKRQREALTKAIQELKDALAQRSA